MALVQLLGINTRAQLTIGGGSTANLLLNRYFGCAGSFLRLVEVDSISTLQTALNNAQPGDRIHLLGENGGGPVGGVYNGKFDANVGGTSSNRVVICCDPSDPATIQEPDTAPARCKITDDYISIYGLKFLGGTVDTDPVIWVSSAQFIEIIGCDLSQGSGQGHITVDQTQGSIFAYNYIHHGGLTNIDHGFYYRENGLIGSSAQRSYIVRNLVAFMAGRGVSCHDNGQGPDYNVTVAHNTIVGTGNTGILSEFWEGTGDVIANNLLSMNGQTTGNQMKFDSGRGVIIANNVRWHTTPSKRGIQEAFETGYSAADYTDTGNVDASDPLLTSLSLSGAPGRGSTDSGDLHIQTGSSAIGLGLQEYSVSPDYSNTAVSSPYDSGAYRK